MGYGARRAGTNQNSKIFQSTLIGKESEGTLTSTHEDSLAWIHNPGGDTLSCTNVYVPAEHTHAHIVDIQDTPEVNVRGDRSLDGGRTWRLIHQWIRKQANITRNKQMISVLNPRGGASATGSGSNPPTVYRYKPRGKACQ